MGVELLGRRPGARQIDDTPCSVVVRSYLGDGTFYEIPWSSSEADAKGAKADALEALSRIDELERPDDAVERRVLVTWA
jgi:hypothetical protein